MNCELHSLCHSSCVLGSIIIFFAHNKNLHHMLNTKRRRRRDNRTSTQQPGRTPILTAPYRTSLLSTDNHHKQQHLHVHVHLHVHLMPRRRIQRKTKLQFNQTRNNEAAATASTSQRGVGTLLALSVIVVGFVLVVGVWNNNVLDVTTLEIYYNSTHPRSSTNNITTTSSSRTALSSSSLPSSSLSPSSSMRLVKDDKSRPTGCHFEDGNGHYENNNNINNNKTSDGTSLTLSYNWIHNQSAYNNNNNNRSCNIMNHIEAIQQNRYKFSKPIVIITLGDSLDRNTVMEYMCDENLGWTMITTTNQQQPQPQPQRTNQKKNKKKNSLNKPERVLASGICTNNNNKNNSQQPQISFAFFKIFGMHHGCENGGALNRIIEPNQRSNTTAERVKHYLPIDILSHYLSNDTQFVFMASSCLWDLSPSGSTSGGMGKECNNNPNGVSKEYQALYRQGIIDLYGVLQTLVIPSSPLIMYWRTSPAVSMEYDYENKKKGYGRTRGNQEILNSILKETVAEHSLGMVVDWWNMANQRSEIDRGTKPDGKHYLGPPSLAFFNMFLNALFDHHPELLLSSL